MRSIREHDAYHAAYTREAMAAIVQLLRERSTARFIGTIETSQRRATVADLVYAQPAEVNSTVTTPLLHQEPLVSTPRARRYL